MIDQQEDLLKLTKHELLQVATDLDVKYRTRMGKPELVDSILEVILEKRRELDLDQDKTEIHQMATAKETMEASRFVPLETPSSPHREPAPAGLGQQVLEDHQHIPAGYGDNIVVMMVIDPVSAYAYWEVTDWKRDELLRRAGAEGQPYNTAIRLYDVTDIKFNGNNAWSTKEFTVNYAQNWYFQVAANRSYCMEIGLRLNDKRFLVIARSNVVSTPRETVSDFYDEEWMMIDFNKNRDLYNELYRLSGGHVIRQYQLNSSFVTERGHEEIKLEMPIQSLSSEYLSSNMDQKVESKKDFWLWVDTELIVYGQTKADAKALTINGEKIQLDKEGRFRLHMALPNGRFPFQVKAVSSDSSMSEEITPVVNRWIE
jgi:hypothetical protein